jgi:hypothetical protein
MVTGVLMGIAAAALVRPWCGLLVGGLVVLALVRPRWRWLLSLFPAAALVVCGLYVASNQIREDWVTDINWPTRFWRLRTLGWLAMVTLVADAVVGLVRRAEPTGAEPVSDALETQDQTVSGRRGEST